MGQSACFPVSVFPDLHLFSDIFPRVDTWQQPYGGKGVTITSLPMASPVLGPEHMRLGIAPENK